MPEGNRGGMGPEYTVKTGGSGFYVGAKEKNKKKLKTWGRARKRRANRKEIGESANRIRISPAQEDMGKMRGWKLRAKIIF